MKIIYQEYDIEEVLGYFVQGFANAAEIKRWETNYDPHTGKVIFKLYGEEEKP